MLLDFMSFSTTKIKAARRVGCAAPACGLISGLRANADDANLGPDIEVASLAELAAHTEIIDIRTADEVAAAPSTARHIAMHVLLANPQLLCADTDYVLVCASGKRSLATARELRKRGLAVRSLAGGLGRAGG